MLVSGSSRSCSVKEEDEQDVRGTPGQTEFIDRHHLGMSWAGQQGRAVPAVHPINSPVAMRQTWHDKSGRSKVKSAQHVQPTSAGDKAQTCLNLSSATTAGWAEKRCPGPCGRGCQRVPGEASQKHYAPLMPLGHWHRDPIFFFLFLFFNAK